MSLPSRERGLKLNIIQHVFVAVIVAPLAGAWIEIDIKEWIARREGVAPLAGAWIEIVNTASVMALSESLPSRERGLKSFVICSPEGRTKVAPLAGAWIEITSRIRLIAPPWSLPSRERGLKCSRVSAKSTR